MFPAKKAARSSEPPPLLIIPSVCSVDCIPVILTDYRCCSIKMINEKLMQYIIEMKSSYLQPVWLKQVQYYTRKLAEAELSKFDAVVIFCPIMGFLHAIRSYRERLWPLYQMINEIVAWSCYGSPEKWRGCLLLYITNLRRRQQQHTPKVTIGLGLVEAMKDRVDSAKRDTSEMRMDRCGLVLQRRTA